MLQGEADGVIDVAGGDFVVADQASKDGQAGSVGGSPSVRALLVAEEIPDGSGACRPAVGATGGGVQLVEETVGVIEHEDMLIAGIGLAFNGVRERDGHRAGIAFARRIDVDDR